MKHSVTVHTMHLPRPSPSTYKATHKSTLYTASGAYEFRRSYTPVALKWPVCRHTYMLVSGPQTLRRFSPFCTRKPVDQRLHTCTHVHDIVYMHVVSFFETLYIVLVMVHVYFKYHTHWMAIHGYSLHKSAWYTSISACRACMSMQYATAWPPALSTFTVHILYMYTHTSCKKHFVRPLPYHVYICSSLEGTLFLLNSSSLQRGVRSTHNQLSYIAEGS